MNARKAVLPKLWSVLKEGGRGCAAATFHNLLPLLSRLPAEPTSDHCTLYQLFLTNVHTGYICISYLYNDVWFLFLVAAVIKHVVDDSFVFQHYIAPVHKTLNCCSPKLIALLGPFHGAIAVPSVTHCRRRRRGR